MRAQSVVLRPGTRNDAVTVAALSVQVFLDTYATDGVRPDLAREALREYSEQAFLARLSTPSRCFVHWRSMREMVTLMLDRRSTPLRGESMGTE